MTAATNVAGAWPAAVTTTSPLSVSWCNIEGGWVGNGNFDLAALTGGVSLVDTNDPLAGIDRAVRDASSHYVLGYEPATSPKRNESRQIEVRVRRPGVRVLARRGYRVADAPAPPPMKVPDSLTPELRTLLAGVMPDDALPMRVQAIAVDRKGKIATVAVIVEVNGS